MGVPAFFRWLSKKYPSIVVECNESVDTNYEFDNLYLDMNGIIHPCSHPEYKSPPETEDDMFVAIFEYVERIMKIVRPKKLLYMAVDGVAPRAKMNQQRSRRFRASQESYDKLIEIQKIKQQLRDNGIEVNDKPKESHFDSNVITPGTQFMINLSDALRQWIDSKLSIDYEDRDNIWPKDLMVILSDASVPGEGEHKIMEYIRKQKSQTLTYDPNLSHCLYGADADLIMLGLATHELNFTILREEFKPNQPKPCDICGQLGHEMKECLGTERTQDEEPPILPTEPEFIFIRLNVLREYLQKECSTASVKLDLERFIDDFVFLCFFVGNDFLPHLPSLEIRENAIDRLINIYKDIMSKHKDPDNPYLTKDGSVNMSRVQFVLQELGEVEDEIFKRRQENEIRFKERRKRQKRMQQNIDSVWLRPEAIVPGQRPQVFDNTRSEAYKLRTAANNDNLSAAQNLKAMLKSGDFSSESETKEINSNSNTNAVGISNKRKREDETQNPDNDSDEEPEDLVQLYNDGWKERYYYHKFDSSGITDISSAVAREYIKGLSWVLLYYYQGCPDWKWFYPFHYAPFASDFVDIANVEVKFDSDAQPFNPLEQLMSVFPAASSQNLPPTWRQLMSDLESPIIDFYPNTFKIDLNGKKAAWMGVALLPFIDEDRLFNALQKVYPDLTEEEKKRNARGTHLIFVSRSKSDSSDFSKEIVESSQTIEVQINPSIFRGISGTLAKSESYSTVYKKVFCTVYKDPVYDKSFVFPAIRLQNAISPPIVLRPEDLDKLERYSWRPTIGMRPSHHKAYINDCGMRMISHAVNQRDRNQYDNQYNQSNWSNSYERNTNQYSRNSYQNQQQYNSYYRPPHSHQSNFNPRYQDSSQSQYQNPSQYQRGFDSSRDQQIRNNDWRQSSQRNSNSSYGSYQRNQYSSNSYYSQQNPNYGHQNTNPNFSQQNPNFSQQNPNFSQQNPRNFRPNPYYGQNPDRREDPWNNRR
jgi:5'-3' exoribonuclease 2